MMQSNSITRGEQEPKEVAKQLALGFKAHDERNREEAIEAFAVVDQFQFCHVSVETARKAAEAYVDALWEKDAVEQSCMVDGEMDMDALDEANWEPVRLAFERRASLVGMNPAYAELSTVAWRRHKTGGDYWTPMMKAQMYELRAALQDPDYPHKPRYGQSGFGPEPAQYNLGVEYHDTRQWKKAVQAMTPYFQRIADEHAQHSAAECRCSPASVS